MPRSSSSTGGAVNHLTVDELREVLGPTFEDALRGGISSYFAEIGLAIAEALIQGEVDSLVGRKYQRDADRAAVRWGSQPGVIQVDGGKATIQKPRVRTKDGKHEVDLETYAAFNRKSALSKSALALIGSGVSTRDYVKVVSAELRKHGVSKSAVSRRVVEATKASLDAFQSRRLDSATFVALLFDGIRLGKVHVVAAVGIDKSGKKHVLGWNRGSSENHVVCRDLIRRLVDAGLKVDSPYLFIVDGSKALELAIKERFGDHSLIQRCQEHKIRDVEGYLNRKQAKVFRIKLQAAYNERTYDAASKRLQKIRGELSLISGKAVTSLTEGMEATLTLHRIGITGGVRESLRTTNIIESTFARLRQRVRNVSNWQDGDQVDRWLAFGLLKAEQGYRRIPGHRQLARLQQKITSIHTASQLS